MIELVLIPALGCDARLYGPLLPLLPASVSPTTVIPDRDSFADCAEQVLTMAPENFVALGTSFGGRVAIELALIAPERLRGLVVIGAGPGPVADAVMGGRRSQRLRGGEFEQVITEMAAIISYVPGPNGISTQHDFKAMARTQGAALMARQSDALAKRTDLWPRMAEIECPALMLWGRHDQFSPAAEGLRLANAAGQGRYAELAECGHFPTLEYPSESAAAISHWLADNGLS